MTLALYGLPVLFDDAAPADGYVYIPPIATTAWWFTLLPEADRMWYDRIGPAAAATGAIVVRDRVSLQRAVDPCGHRSSRWRYSLMPDDWPTKDADPDA